MSIETAKRVLRIEAEAIQGVSARLDGRFERAVETLLACKGRVVVTGMGKSGLIGRKIAATFSSTGTPSLFLHPAEALHGDLGMMLAGDAVLAISYGGETEEIVALLPTIKRLGLPLVTLTGNLKSTLAAASAVALEPTTCVLVPRQAFFSLLETYPTMVRGLLVGLTHRLAELTNRLTELSGGRVEERLARFFLKLADSMGQPGPDGTRIPMALSRQELADMIGTTIETSIRIMSRWGKQGIVRTEKDGFVLLDRAALETAGLS